MVARDPFLESIGAWLLSLPTARFMHSAWGWPFCESLHFLGLCLLLGAIGIFDLRLMGFAPRIPIGALHRLVPWGVAGFCINAVTGFMFLTGAPDQYFYNDAFKLKVVFLTLAGLNVAFFYAATFRSVRLLPPDVPPPLRARVAGAVSLLLWIGVISAGRLLTFFRPAFIN